MSADWDYYRRHSYLVYESPPNKWGFMIKRAMSDNPIAEVEGAHLKKSLAKAGAEYHIDLIIDEEDRIEEMSIDEHLDEAIGKLK